MHTHVYKCGKYSLSWDSYWILCQHKRDKSVCTICSLGDEPVKLSIEVPRQRFWFTFMFVHTHVYKCGKYSLSWDSYWILCQHKRDKSVCTICSLGDEPVKLSIEVPRQRFWFTFTFLLETIIKIPLMQKYPCFEI